MDILSAAIHAISVANDGAPLAPLPLGPNIFTVIEERRAARVAREEEERMQSALSYWYDTAMDLERRLGAANDLRGRLGGLVAKLETENGQIRDENARLVFENRLRRENAIAFEEGIMEVCRSAEQRQRELEARCDGLAAQVRLLRAALLDACPEHEFLEAIGRSSEDGTPLCYDEMIRDMVTEAGLAELAERQHVESTDDVPPE